MPKYIVSLEDYAFFSVPVEAPTEEEAKEKAFSIVAGNHEYPADFAELRFADPEEHNIVNPDQVDDACFERFGGVAA